MRNPINRIIAIGGLVLLLPIGYLMAVGDLTPEEAGMRAGLLLVAVIVIRKVARIGLGVVAVSMERRAVLPQRRVTDQPVDAA